MTVYSPPTRTAQVYFTSLDSLVEHLITTKRGVGECNPDDLSITYYDHHDTVCSFDDEDVFSALVIILGRRVTLPNQPVCPPSSPMVARDSGLSLSQVSAYLSSADGKRMESIKASSPLPFTQRGLYAVPGLRTWQY